MPQELGFRLALPGPSAGNWGENMAQYLERSTHARTVSLSGIYFDQLKSFSQPIVFPNGAVGTPQPSPHCAVISELQIL